MVTIITRSQMYFYILYSIFYAPAQHQLSTTHSSSSTSTRRIASVHYLSESRPHQVLASLATSFHPTGHKIPKCLWGHMALPTSERWQRLLTMMIQVCSSPLQGSSHLGARSKWISASCNYEFGHKPFKNGLKPWGYFNARSVPLAYPHLASQTRICLPQGE